MMFTAVNYAGRSRWAYGYEPFIKLRTGRTIAVSRAFRSHHLAISAERLSRLGFNRPRYHSVVCRLGREAQHFVHPSRPAAGFSASSTSA